MAISSKLKTLPIKGTEQRKEIFQHVINPKQISIMKILIKVTKEVLRRSARCKAGEVTSNCAIALAIRDIFPKANVLQFGMAFDNESAIQYDIKFERRVIDFIEWFDINDYDERLMMNPISFEIDVSDSVIEEIGLDEVHKILSESETLELVS